MATYRVREAAQLLGVSDDTVRRWAEAGELGEIGSDEVGRRVLDGPTLAAFAQDRADRQHAERLDPRAGAQGARVAQSARNRLVGLVTRVTRDTVMAQVELQCGPHRVVSLMSREAADDLALEPGVLAVAAIKSTNVVVEVPRS
ncbi:MAG: TOBE domain-containing protein [Marmoricola sp.]